MKISKLTKILIYFDALTVFKFSELDFRSLDKFGYLGIVHRRNYMEPQVADRNNADNCKNLILMNVIFKWGGLVFLFS